MKFALVVAHPRRQSFVGAMATTFESAVSARSHSVIKRDLYEMDFDPRLAADEMPGAAHFAPHDDVKAERALLAGCNAFAFFYPLWFNTPPAILKGYLERVFGLGFGYAAGPSGTEQLLKGRTMISFSSSGAPSDWVRSTGAFTALCKLFDEHFASVCGLNVVDHVHLGNVVPGMRADAVERLLGQVRAAAEKHF